MSNEQGPRERLSGCPPHEFGNALAWRWTRQMPPSCKGGFLTLLYAMRAMASASGELRFSGDGKPIRIQDIAKAAGSREKDVRRYLEAAMLAGVVVTVGERRRGKPTLYCLVNVNGPNWAAAADYLKRTARARKTSHDDSDSSGRSGPNTEEEVRATAARTDPGTFRATAAPMSSGHGGPFGSGHGGPNNPGSTQEQPQEMAGVGPQPQERAGAPPEDDFPQRDVVGAAARPGESDDADVLRFCPCGKPLVRMHRDRCAKCIRADEAKAAAGDQRRTQDTFLLPRPGGDRGAPQSRHAGDQRPIQDSSALLRVCGCGRAYRAAQPGRCLDCLMAEYVAEGSGA